MSELFYQWMLGVSRLQVIVGAGSPEGVVEALPTALYMNSAGVAGAILYIKRDSAIAADRTKGWILV